MEKGIVLVDMDNVLANLELGFLNAYRRAFPNRPFIPLEEQDKFFPRSSYVERFESKYPNIDQEISEICYAPGFIRTLPVITGAKEGIETLLDNGYDVRICTSPLKVANPCIGEKAEWTEEELGVKWCDRLIICKDKTLVQARYLIDDNSKVKGVITPTWEQILFIKEPYNTNSPITKRMTWQSDYLSLLE